MTTPADELRTAAAQLRELATAASTISSGRPTARWHFKKHDHGHDSGYLYAENPDGPGVRLTPSVPGNPAMRTRHGEYAAAMDPTVGLLLAELLETAAEYVADDSRAHPTHLVRAVAVARAINGGERR